MTQSPIVRARLLGLLVCVLSFAAGVLAGIAIDRRPRQGLSVMVTATTSRELPRELERLDLSEAQQRDIQTILVRGRDRVLAVVHEFEPKMKLAMDSTNAEIDAVLTAAQRASLATYRRDHPPVVNQKIIRK